MKRVILSALFVAFILTACTKMITLPVDNKYCKGKQYTDVYEIFAKEGFTNIITEVDNNSLVFPWSKNGAVTEVTVSGKNSFKINDAARKNDKIIIRYIEKKKE